LIDLYLEFDQNFQINLYIAGHIYDDFILKIYSCYCSKYIAFYYSFCAILK